jgi:probable phosphoglycerate mutase
MARNTLVGWAPDLGTPTTLVLLRHGETSHTQQRRFSGGTGRGGDPDLTETGRWQAAQAAERLATWTGRPGDDRHPRPAIDAIVSSPMQRTQSTARTVADRLGLDVEVDPGFTECDFGAWDGLTYEDVEARWSVALGEWFASTGHPPIEGESFDDVQVRIEHALDELVRRHRGRTVLVVTHVTPIKSIVRHTLRAPTDALFRLELAPASLTSVEFFADGVSSVRFVNDATHLLEPPRA